ncbi:hypothetical protein [Streptomyces sp. NPDC023838]
MGGTAGTGIAEYGTAPGNGGAADRGAGTVGCGAVAGRADGATLA